MDQNRKICGKKSSLIAGVHRTHAYAHAHARLVLQCASTEAGYLFNRRNPNNAVEIVPAWHKT